MARQWTYHLHRTLHLSFSNFSSSSDFQFILAKLLLRDAWLLHNYKDYFSQVKQSPAKPIFLVPIYPEQPIKRKKKRKKKLFSNIHSLYILMPINFKAVFYLLLTWMHHPDSFQTEQRHQNHKTKQKKEKICMISIFFSKILTLQHLGNWANYKEKNPTVTTNYDSLLIETQILLWLSCENEKLI